MRHTCYLLSQSASSCTCVYYFWLIHIFIIITADHLCESPYFIWLSLVLLLCIVADYRQLRNPNLWSLNQAAIVNLPTVRWNHKAVCIHWNQGPYCNAGIQSPAPVLQASGHIKLSNRSEPDLYLYLSYIR